MSGWSTVTLKSLSSHQRGCVIYKTDMKLFLCSSCTGIFLLCPMAETQQFQSTSFKCQINSSTSWRALYLIPVAIMAARMRATILIPLLMISFSSPLKEKEKGSLVAPDQSHPEHRGAVCSWKSSTDKQRHMGHAWNCPSNAAVFQHYQWARLD